MADTEHLECDISFLYGHLSPVTLKFLFSRQLSQVFLLADHLRLNHQLLNSRQLQSMTVSNCPNHQNPWKTSTETNAVLLGRLVIIFCRCLAPIDIASKASALVPHCDCQEKTTRIVSKIWKAIRRNSSIQGTPSQPQKNVDTAIQKGVKNWCCCVKIWCCCFTHFPDSDRFLSGAIDPYARSPSLGLPFDLSWSSLNDEWYLADDLWPLTIFNLYQSCDILDIVVKQK